MSNQSEKLVKKNDMVVVTGAAGSKYLKEGKDYEVHALVAEKYEKKGVAKIDKKKTEALKAKLK